MEQKRHHSVDTHPLTLEQAKHLLKVARGYSLEAFMTVALTCGLRRGELIGLRWQDLDIGHELLSVEQAVFLFGKVEETDTLRMIALPKRALDTLNEHRSVQEEMCRITGETWQDNGLIFPNEHGHYFRPSHLHQQFTASIAAAELPPMRVHGIRQSTLALLLNMGLCIEVIQSILGHRYLSLAIETLTHMSLSMQRGAMKR